MAVTLYLFALLVVFIGLLIKFRERSALPGPHGLKYLQIMYRLLGISSKDIVPELIQLSKEYGDIFEIQMLGTGFVVLSDPELIKPLLSSSTNISKGSLEYSFLKPVFKEGLLVSNGDKWRTRRKILTPSFHFKILETSIETVSQNAEEYVSQLLASGGKPTKIEDKIYSLVLKIICETAMGVKLDTEDKCQNEFIKASKICHDGIIYRFLRFWLFPEFIYRLSNAGKRFLKSADNIYILVDQVIKNRKELFITEKHGEYNNMDSQKKERNAFLDNLLQLDQSNPGLITESGIKEEVGTFMIAGHNPSGAALQFLHFLLANHPDVQKKAYDEQVEIFGDDMRSPTAQDIQKMTYLEMVIKESLRLYPSIPLHTRLLKEDQRLDENTIIPAGHSILVFTYGVHRSEKYWDNPEEFIPERFAPGIERHPFSFIPFSAGPRNCIGQKYAMMELKTIMSTVLRHCWLESVTTSVDLDYSVTLKPENPIIVKVFPRNGTL